MSLRLQTASLVITDVDGVLTDGGMFYGNDGSELKKFSVYDGGGVLLLKKAGIPLVVMTGEDAPCVTNRCRKLKIDDYRVGVKNKLAELDGIVEEYGIPAKNIVFVGDFVNDKAIMECVGLPVCPASACEEIKELSVFITRSSGGQGVLWEVARTIASSKGLYEELVTDLV